VTGGFTLLPMHCCNLLVSCWLGRDICSLIVAIMLLNDIGVWGIFLVNYWQGPLDGMPMVIVGH